ncbi:hypothetical protein Fcan01_11479 [Folsomia candida]|uniref:Uncharacterized protein n=1 Tax=Folsomia candida TaxID=158441 RepID=A0A226EAQ8_FOLCA|nr:hypothetical protein Fcan01_11479 [Folsomia candida]
MVLTPLMWKSLDNFATSYSYLYPCPLEWDKKSGKLVCNKISRKLVPWTISVFVGMSSIFIFCLVLLSSQLFGLARIELSDLLLTAVFLCLATFSILLEIVLLQFADCFSHSFNCGITHLRRLAFGRIFLESPPHSIDPLGVTLNLIVAMFSAYPYFMYPFVIYLGIDPFTLTLHYLLPYDLTLLTVIFTLLRLSVISSLIQGNRLFSCVAVTTTISAHVGLSLISVMHRSTRNIYLMGVGRRAIDKYLSGYQTCQIILEIAVDFVSSGILIVMFLGFSFSVALNFMTMKTYGIIPMPFYAFFPSGSILIAVLISFMLPMLVDLFENCGEMYARWKCLVAGNVDKKYLRRKLKATRVVRLYGGMFGYNIYICKRSTKLAYYGWILSYTITALLSVDRKSILRRLE